MEPQDKKPPMQCDGKCPTCPVGGGELPLPTAPNALAGWRLIVAAVAAFLLPLALAVLGGIVVGNMAGGTSDARTGAGLGGLLVGIVLAVLIGRFIRPHVHKECP